MPAWIAWKEKRTSPCENFDDEYTAEERARQPAPYPESRRRKMAAFIHVHSARFALVAWNLDGYIGGGGRVHRLDVHTGELELLAKVTDIWSVTTCPRTGRVFVVTCYDGWVVQALAGSVETTPETGGLFNAAPQPTLLASVEGPGLAFARGVLFSASPNAAFLIAPPGEVVDGVSSDEVVPLKRPPEDNTPGDRSSPWTCYRLLPPHPFQKRPGLWKDMFPEFQHQFVGVRGRTLTVLQGSELISIDLSARDAADDALVRAARPAVVVARADGPIAAVAGDGELTPWTLFRRTDELRPEAG